MYTSPAWPPFPLSFPPYCLARVPLVMEWGLGLDHDYPFPVAVLPSSALVPKSCLSCNVQSLLALPPYRPTLLLAALLAPAGSPACSKCCNKFERPLELLQVEWKRRQRKNWCCCCCMQHAHVFSGAHHHACMAAAQALQLPPMHNLRPMPLYINSCFLRVRARVATPFPSHGSWPLA